jgi:hypothetical protein
MSHIVEQYEEADHIESIQHPSQYHYIVLHEEEGDHLNEYGDCDRKICLTVVGFDVTVDEAIELLILRVDLYHGFIV